MSATTGLRDCENGYRRPNLPDERYERKGP
jgi:hypothetical protein